MTTCTNCGKEIKEGVAFCTACGTKVEISSEPAQQEKEPASGKWKPFVIVLIITAVIFGVYTLYSLYSLHKAKLEGNNAYNTGNYLAAAEHFRYISRKTPKNEEAWIMLGESFRSAEKYDKAEAILKKALSLHPSSTHLLVTLGHVYYEKKIYKDAQKYLNDALKKDKNLYQAHLYLGLTLKAIGKPRTALKHLEKALPDATREDIINIQEALADTYNTLGEYKKAAELLERAIDADPNRFSLRIAASKSYFALKDYKNAVMHINGALKINPNSQEAKTLEKEMTESMTTAREEVYLARRDELDARYMRLYTELHDFISYLNKEMDNIMGKPNPKVDAFAKEAEALDTEYHNLTPPERHYTVHAICLANVALLRELIHNLRDFINSGTKDDREELQSLANRIDTISRENERLFEIWNSEKAEIKTEEKPEPGKNQNQNK